MGKVLYIALAKGRIKAKTDTLALQTDNINSITENKTKNFLKNKECDELWVLYGLARDDTTQ